MKICKYPNCERELTKAYARGLCNMHYQRLRIKSPELIKRQQRHGMYRTRIYFIWQNIKGRCLNPTDAAYARYGGRGITICERWLVFNNFVDDVGERPSPKHSIDRIDNNKGYSPENCRWASPEVQLFNRGQMRNNTSGVKGVHFSKQGQWHARIGLNGKHKFLGSFKTKAEAVVARQAAERERLSVL